MRKNRHRGGHRGRGAEWRVGALVLAACVVVATTGQAQPPDLDELLDKAADYVVSYKHDFVGVVADETYRQNARGAARGTDLRGFPTEPARQKRDLRADVLFVRTPDADFWMQFRDVYEVDGQPVRDRAERLTKLFLEPSRSAKQQADDIATESARYNIG